MADGLRLAAEFPTPTRADWRALVARVLARSGVEFPTDVPEQALTSRTADGIEIEPLYDPAPPPGVPGLAPFIRGRTAVGNRTGWDIRARQTNPDVRVANAQALEDLAGGATSLWLRLGAAGSPVSDLPGLLDEILLEVIAVDLDAGAEALPAADAYLALAADRGVDRTQLTGSLGLDPIGVLARTGSEAGLAEAMGEVAARASRLGSGDYPGLRCISADALVFHDAGATDSLELGASLALGLAHARNLAEGGLPTRAAFAQIQFRYAATADQFATIAKLRAARRCWARIAEVSGVTGEAAGQYQHAVTSWSMMTRQDPWTNLLRTTVACFGACAGGADAVTVLPFDAALGLPDPLARRIARNTPSLLVEESHVAAVLDPAGGSGFVEALTDALAREAWTVFTEIERNGGIIATLRNGWLAERIGAAREARLARIADGAETILGVTAYPLEGEQPPIRAQAPDPPGGGLPRVRWAHSLEVNGA